MKNILKLLTALCFVLVITSCQEENDFNYVLFTDEAPTRVQATVEIATDNSGLVTVTPLGDGVASYRILFGDPNNTEVLIGPRNAVATHVYPEGNYTIRILATSPNDKVTEITEDISVETTAILNIESGLIVSETAKEVELTPIADNATQFEINFGDGTVETVNAGNSIRHTYAAGGDFQIDIEASNPDTGKSNSSAEFITIQQGPLDLLLTFDDPLTDYTLNPFNGVSTEIVVNPNLSGTNEEESNVAAITNSGNAFEGFVYDLPTPIDFGSNKKTMFVKVFNDTGNTIPITLQFVNGVNGERGAEVVTNHTGSGWETLEFNFFNASKVFIPNDPENFQSITPTGQYGTIAFFIDGPGSTQGTFFLDDFEQSLGDAPAGPQYVFDFEGGPLEGSFDFGAPIQIVDNPFPNAVNSSPRVLEIQRGSGLFQGSGFNIPLLDLTTDDKIITIKLYSEIPALLSVDLKISPTGARSANVQVNHTGSGWEELTLDYSNATKAFEPDDPENFAPLPANQVGAYTQIVFIVNGPNEDTGTFYMDDIIKP
ncbi:PKD domain-containing protein [Hyunsoonleella ulvae]|uniref:PKD domain-containing protein n=1 Tax=Hyunsoonleella ulvae TaxID=2799948 RepID=UPI00193A709E|nr:PKD domain-containing protein [Hyunsoonleella ulvae]